MEPLALAAWEAPCHVPGILIRRGPIFWWGVGGGGGVGLSVTQ